MIKLSYTLHAVPVPVSYEVLLIEGRAEVRIDRMLQEDGSYKWSIRNGFGMCLSTLGKWDYESMPSNRPEDWIATHRFDTFEKASELAHVVAQADLDEYKRRVNFVNEREAQRADS
jgi:hypothetical protein